MKRRATFQRCWSSKAWVPIGGTGDQLGPAADNGLQKVTAALTWPTVDGAPMCSSRVSSERGRAIEMSTAKGYLGAFTQQAHRSGSNAHLERHPLDRLVHLHSFNLQSLRQSAVRSSMV